MGGLNDPPFPTYSYIADMSVSRYMGRVRNNFIFHLPFITKWRIIFLFVKNRAAMTRRMKYFVEKIESENETEKDGKKIK